MNVDKKKLMTLSLLSIPILGDLYAENDQTNNLNNYSESQEKICFKDPQSHYLVRGDLLYWIPQISGLEVNFGTNSVYRSTRTDNVTETTSIERDTDLQFDWDVGYRVGVGYQFDCNRWESNVIWTHFQGYGHKSINHGSWNVKLDQLDTVFVYRAAINPSFTLKPFIGIGATKIHQKLYSQVVIDIDLAEEGIATDTKTFNDSQKFNAIGPVFGFNSDIKIGRGFGAYGNIALNLQYGTYHLIFDDDDVVTEPATPIHVISSLKKNMYSFDFNLNLALGVQWQTLIRNSVYLTLKAGLENLQYFDQSRLGSNWGNLSFSGGSFSLMLEF